MQLEESNEAKDECAIPSGGAGAVVRPGYLSSSWQEKCRILNEFVELTGYGRKHAITLFNHEINEPVHKPAGRIMRQQSRTSTIPL